MQSLELDISGGGLIGGAYVKFFSKGESLLKSFLKFLTSFLESPRKPIMGFFRFKNSGLLDLLAIFVCCQ